MRESARPRAARSSDGFLWPSLGIFVLALAARFVYLWQVRSAIFFGLKLGDAESYHAWATRIAAGDWLGSDVFYQAPLYPYFLGAIYGIVGHDPLVVRVCQAIVGSGACVLLARAGRDLFGRATGIVAGLILSCYAPAIFSDGLLQKSVLDLLFVCLLLALLGKAVERDRTASWLSIGLVTGCLVLTRENALVFVVALLLWLFLRHRGSGKRSLLPAGAFLLALFAVLVPVGLRNLVVGGEFHLTTSQFGPNFYIGNNEQADGTYRPLRFGRGHPRFERRDARAMAERITGISGMTPAAVSRFWAGRALNFIRSEPDRWLLLTGRKLALLCDATEGFDTEDLYTHAEASSWLRLTGSVLHFGVVAPLALLGLWVTWPQRSRLWPLYLLIAAYAGSVLLFYVFARYRYPLVPFLVLFAAAGVVGAVPAVRAWSSRRRTAVAASIAALALFCNWPVTDRDAMRATTAINIGQALYEAGRVDEAVLQLRKALAIRPDHPGAHYNLALALTSRGEMEQAVSHLRRAIELKSNYARAYFRLGSILARLGRPQEAIDHYVKAVALDPYNADAHYNMANTLQELGRLEEALISYRRALEIRPDFAGAYNNLGTTLARQGRWVEAIDAYREALRIEPTLADAHANLGVALKATGRPAEAEFHAREAIRLNREAADDDER